MKHIDTMKLALEALEADYLAMVADGNGHMVYLEDQAIAALREALAKPDFWEGYLPEPVKPAQQEPVAYIHRQGNHYEVSERFLSDDEKSRGWTEEPLYTSPPAQRKWVGLTPEETLEEAHKEEQVSGFIHGASWASFKLRERNT